MYSDSSKKKYVNQDYLVYSCQYHVTFCTRYKKDTLINGVEKKVKEIFEEVAKKDNFKISEITILPDRVYLLIDCNPIDIIDHVKQLKEVSTDILRIEFPKLLFQTSTIWSRGAFVSTVGNVSPETIDYYVENLIQPPKY